MHPPCRTLLSGRHPKDRIRNARNRRGDCPGTFLDDAQGEITYLDEVLDLGRGAAPGERSVLSAQTTSTFEITKVIQGDLQVGDQIKISEPYYVDNQDGVETIKRSPGCSELYRLLSRGRNICSFSTIHSTKERKLEYTSLFGMNSAGIRLFIP